MQINYKKWSQKIHSLNKLIEKRSREAIAYRNSLQNNEAAEIVAIRATITLLQGIANDAIMLHETQE